MPDINEEEYRRLNDFRRILTDLDRCEHGRHSLDSCSQCSYLDSRGNTFLKSGQRIGTDLSGNAIVVPENTQFSNPSDWIVRAK